MLGLFIRFGGLFAPFLSFSNLQMVSCLWMKNFEDTKNRILYRISRDLKLDNKSLKLKRSIGPGKWDTLLWTHCCRHKCFPVCPRAQHLLRTQILCPGHIKCFWCCSETFCVRNKCFPVCASQETSWATMSPRLPGPYCLQNISINICCWAGDSKKDTNFLTGLVNKESWRTKMQNQNWL